MYRNSKDMILPFSALATFAYVLFWLSQHRFMEQPHHYLTALVIAGWLASLPFVFAYRFNRKEKPSWDSLTNSQRG